MKLVGIENISVSYGDVKALENASLDIYSDDFLGVIGPNGGGKTTLVKAILKSVPYKGGKITYSPEICNARNDNAKSRSIGYLPQINVIDKSFPISVMEVVLSGLQSTLRLTGNYHNHRSKAVGIMELCGISQLADRPIGQLSGGQLQRTLLGRALISDPKLLILDEPANFVDNKFEKELYELLRELNSRMAIVMVSHDLGTISSYVKSIVCVNKHVHRHDSNIITPEQLLNYECPIQVVTHGEIAHTVLGKHKH